MKNKKGQTIYEEAIFPGTFKVKYARVGQCVLKSDSATYLYSMPAILTGWVQDHLHLQFSWQSLQ